MGTLSLWDALRSVGCRVAWLAGVSGPRNTKGHHQRGSGKVQPGFFLAEPREQSTVYPVSEDPLDEVQSR